MKRTAKPKPQPAPPPPTPAPTAFELKEQIRKQQAELDEARRTASQADTIVRSKSEALKKTHETLQGLRDMALLGVLSPEVINALAPEHSRTSCMDTNTCNAGDCPRCSLLDAHRVGYIDFDFRFEVQRRRLEA